MIFRLVPIDPKLDTSLSIYPSNVCVLMVKVLASTNYTVSSIKKNKKYASDGEYNTVSTVNSMTRHLTSFRLDPYGISWAGNLGLAYR